MNFSLVEKSSLFAYAFVLKEEEEKLKRLEWYGVFVITQALTQLRKYVTFLFCLLPLKIL